MTTVPPRPPGGALVHAFDADHGDLTAEELTQLLGGKGASLAALTKLQMPVPPGFTLTTVACRRYLDRGWDQELEQALLGGVAELERVTGTHLGDPVRPLLVSVRSGAPVSMPGMMDTVLGVGLTRPVIDGIAERTDDAAFAADTMRRALRGWGAAVGGAPPEDPREQLLAAVHAVFGSWESDLVRRYRQIESIPDGLGTGATVQTMVFGNRPGRSGTGVAFTRHPSSGEPGLVGDFLVSAQGDDVVDGRRTTLHLDALRERWPDLWDELAGLAARLEQHFVDMVDIEFTIEDGRLWLLQARPAKRSARAALRVAVDLAEDPAFPLDRTGAVTRCRHVLDGDDAWAEGAGAGSDDAGDVIAEGIAAAAGRGIGVLCVDVDHAVSLTGDGVAVVLVRRETSPVDVPAIADAAGLVTTLGGLVSHAAVVARSWGIPAVVGVSTLEVGPDGVRGPGGLVAAGEIVTVDGDGGRLLRGEHPAGAGDPPPELAVLQRWSQER
jgi:pyruvate, orthophosphate dikinase